MKPRLTPARITWRETFGGGEGQAHELKHASDKHGGVSVTAWTYMGAGGTEAAGYTLKGAGQGCCTLCSDPHECCKTNRTAFTV